MKMAYSLKLRVIIELVEEIINNHSTKPSYSFEQIETGIWQYIIHDGMDLIARMMLDEECGRIFIYSKFENCWFDTNIPTFVSDFTGSLVAAIN